MDSTFMCASGPIEIFCSVNMEGHLEVRPRAEFWRGGECPGLDVTVMLAEPGQGIHARRHGTVKRPIRPAHPLPTCNGRRPALGMPATWRLAGTCFSRRSNASCGDSVGVAVVLVAGPGSGRSLNAHQRQMKALIEPQADGAVRVNRSCEVFFLNALGAC